MLHDLVSDHHGSFNNEQYLQFAAYMLAHKIIIIQDPLMVNVNPFLRNWNSAKLACFELHFFRN